MSDAASKTFLGSGIGFPVQADGDGVLEPSSYEASVRQSIAIILGTAKGERVMRPDFGCGIHDMVFDNVTASTRGSVTAAVRDALLDFEPRIDVRDVNVSQSGEQGEVLLISIDYEVRATNNAFNLVYPLYLDVGALDVGAAP